jgi:hypothetical protein
LIRLQAGRPGTRTPAETLNVPVLQNVVTDCGANQASQSMGIGRSFLGVNLMGRDVASLRMCVDIPSLPLYVFTMWKGTNLPLTSYIPSFLVSDWVRLSSFMKNDV